MTRLAWGDYIVLASASLNIACMIAYALQRLWPNVLYFFGAACINCSIVIMRLGWLTTTK